MSQEDLIPFNKRTKAEQKEITRKGGIASGIARREKRDRHQRIKDLFAMAVQDPKMLQNLEKLGIKADDMTIEMAMDARQAVKAMKDGDTNAYRTLKTEAYGPLVEKQEIDLNAEVKSINLNIRKYDDTNGLKH